MKYLALLFAIPAGLSAQTGATFEVATVKAAPPPDGRGFTRGCRGGPGTNDPTLWRCTNANVPMLLMRAYGIKYFQLTAPDWAENANYEISARIAPDATKEQLAEMIRNLLADRFGLEFHWMKKEIAIYDLVVARGGPKLKPYVEEPANGAVSDAPDRGSAGKGPTTDAEGYPILPPGCNGCISINGRGKARYHASKATIASFADLLSSQLRMPVNDRTGLAGEYEMTLSWSSGGGVAGRSDADPDTDPAVTVEMAVQRDLGLKLQPTKGPIDMLVVDKLERNPAAN